MTKESYQKARGIINYIERIEKFKCLILDNPLIKDANGYDYMYLSQADNEQGDLKKTITKWCDNEIAKLQKEFKLL